MEKTGVHKCFFCCKEFNWQAHFANPPFDGLIGENGAVEALNVMARGSMPTDLGVNRAVELEIIATCPECKGKNRIITYVKVEKPDRKSVV